MKTKLVVLLAILSLSISGLLAQKRQPVNPEEMAKRHSEMLIEKLKLNETQKEKVYDISLKYSKERDAQMNSDMDREKRREVSQKLQEKQDEELGAIFTPDQKKEYEKFRKEMQEKRGNRDGNRRSR